FPMFVLLSSIDQPDRVELSARAAVPRALNMPTGLIGPLGRIAGAGELRHVPVLFIEPVADPDQVVADLPTQAEVLAAAELKLAELLGRAVPFLLVGFGPLLDGVIEHVGLLSIDMAQPCSWSQGREAHLARAYQCLRKWGEFLSVSLREL